MREEFPVFGVARQFGGQGYSPAKRTLSWLTRGLLALLGVGGRWQ